jgi:hypothetical protein
MGIYGALDASEAILPYSMEKSSINVAVLNAIPAWTKELAATIRPGAVSASGVAHLTGAAVAFQISTLGFVHAADSLDQLQASQFCCVQ